MPNARVAAAAGGLPTRRAAFAALAGAGAALALPKAVHAATPAGQPNPTFALIERHRAAYAALNTLSSEIAGDEPECAAEQDAMIALVEREPDTLAGLRAFAEYFDEHVTRSGDDQPAQWAIVASAEACRRLIAEGGAL